MSLTVRDVSFGFPGAPLLLHGLALDVEQGQAVVVMAPSGTGKTTLLALLGGLRQPRSGTITIQDRPPAPALVSWVFQRMHLILDRSVLDNVTLPALARGVSRDAAQEAAHDALDAFGVARLAGRRAREISGGQAQRVAMARAAVVRAPVVLMDEPTANLDRVTADGVIDVLFAGFRASAVVVATHDPAVAQQADRAYQLVAGKLCGQ